MNTSGEAAEQIVRMSLEGFEVAARITGAGAKNIAILLYSILKEEKKTKGKARLTNMLRSGKELKVFTVKNGDLKKFTQEAKKYGVLYCVLADRKTKIQMPSRCDRPCGGCIQDQPYCGALQTGIGKHGFYCDGKRKVQRIRRTASRSQTSEYRKRQRKINFLTH